MTLDTIIIPDDPLIKHTIEKVLKVTKDINTLGVRKIKSKKWYQFWKKKPIYNLITLPSLNN